MKFSGLLMLVLLRLFSWIVNLTSLAVTASRDSSVGPNLREKFCQSPEIVGTKVPECNCRMESVDHAVNNYVSDILANLTSRSYFRYFLIDLERPCAFWQEDGLCMMEGCSVCACDENEIPQVWQEEDSSNKHMLKSEYVDRLVGREEYGWIAGSALESKNLFDDQALQHKLEQGQADESELAKARAVEKSRVLQAESEIKTEENSGRSSQQYYPPTPSAYSTTGADERAESNKAGSPTYMDFLRDTEDTEVDFSDDWTVIERDEHGAASGISHKKRGIYVNLLANPERFTGYSGPSAARVWRSIQEENCFVSSLGSGIIEETCYERRIFYRLMSGLQSSITTHIAREYYFAAPPPSAMSVFGAPSLSFYSGTSETETRIGAAVAASSDSSGGYWGSNPALFHRGVGAHPMRLQNMYFSFLFLLRAVVKVKDGLQAYPFNTGNSTEDAIVRDLIDKLVGEGLRTAASSPLSDGFSAATALDECKYGFDESELFHVSEELAEHQYWDNLYEKQQLKFEFQQKFRNISRIMDCVSCEKCRLWGKLQILGLGTAIKILLTPKADLMPIELSPVEGWSVSAEKKGLDAARQESRVQLQLTRQEVIALINTMNQFARSIEYASLHASPLTSAPAAIPADADVTTSGKQSAEPETEIGPQAKAEVSSHLEEPAPLHGESSLNGLPVETESETNSETDNKTDNKSGRERVRDVKSDSLLGDGSRDDGAGAAGAAEESFEYLSFRTIWRWGALYLAAVLFLFSLIQFLRDSSRTNPLKKPDRKSS